MSVVAQRLAVLAAVTAAPDQLSPAALQQAMDFLTALLNLTVTAAAGPDLGSTPTLTATAYLSALESVGHLLNAASASVSLAQTLSQPLVERVGVVAQTILSSLACGQTSSVLAITGGPALWTQKATLAAVRGGVITVRGAQFALPADLAVAGLGASECLGVQANEFTNNPYVFAPERFASCPFCCVMRISFLIFFLFFLSRVLSRVSALTMRSSDGVMLPVTQLSTAINITLALTSPIPTGSYGTSKTKEKKKRKKR
jgi:hypothetical protein